MAQKRMFSRQITDTDRFMDMPSSAQALYFHLGMYGDDDGFVASPRKVQRAANCSDDDLRLLISKGYIIPFQSGVIVIVDWKLNNYIQSDRCTPTIYTQEKALLSRDESKRYILSQGVDTKCIQAASEVETQIRLGKNSIEKNSIGADEPPKSTRHKFAPPTVDEVRVYCEERKNGVDPQRFVDHYTANGWMVGKNKMKDWEAAVRTWEKNSDSKESLGDGIDFSKVL